MIHFSNIFYLWTEALPRRQKAYAVASRLRHSSFGYDGREAMAHRMAHRIVDTDCAREAKVYCFNNNIKIRDPFSVPENNKYMTTKQQDEQINLLGITKVDKNFGAILAKNGNREVVFLQDVIWGYLVKEITLDHVLLFKDQKQIKLLV